MVNLKLGSGRISLSVKLSKDNGKPDSYQSHYLDLLKPTLFVFLFLLDLVFATHLRIERDTIYKFHVKILKYAPESAIHEGITL